MADWIEEVAQREAEMIAAGVSTNEAMRVSGLFANALAQADKAKRDAAAKRSERSATANLCRQIGTTEAARELDIAPRTARWRRQQHLAKVGNGNP
jgi:hypothetical protein